MLNRCLSHNVSEWAVVSLASLLKVDWSATSRMKLYHNANEEEGVACHCDSLMWSLGGAMEERKYSPVRDW